MLRTTLLVLVTLLSATALGAQVTVSATPDGASVTVSASPDGSSVAVTASPASSSVATSPSPAGSSVAVVAEAPPSSSRDARFLKGEWSGEQPTLTLDLDHVRTRDALKELAAKAGWSIAFDDRPGGRVDMSFNDVPADLALLAILKKEKLCAERVGTLITIRDLDDDEVEDEDDSSPSSAQSGGSSGNADSKTHERVTMGGSVRVEKDEVVREAVAIGGDVEVHGTVERDAVAVGGNLVLGPTAVVNGDAVSIGGRLSIDPNASVRGDRVNIGMGFPGVVVKPHRDEMPSPFTHHMGNFAWNIVQWATLFVVGLIVLAWFPTRMKNIHRDIRRGPGKSLFLGLVAVPLSMALGILLAITIIGAPIALLVLFLMAVGGAFGLWSLALTIGELLARRFGERSEIWKLAVGMAILFVLCQIPLFGFPLLFSVAVLLGLGSSLRTRFGQGTENDANFSPMP